MEMHGICSQGARTFSGLSSYSPAEPAKAVEMRRTAAAGWKASEIGARQGSNHGQVEHLAGVRNTAWRRFSAGFGN
jgi:hypothetical protein